MSLMSMMHFVLDEPSSQSLRFARGDQSCVSRGVTFSSLGFAGFQLENVFQFPKVEGIVSNLHQHRPPQIIDYTEFTFPIITCFWPRWGSTDTMSSYTQRDCLSRIIPWASNTLLCNKCHFTASADFSLLSIDGNIPEGLISTFIPWTGIYSSWTRIEW